MAYGSVQLIPGVNVERTPTLLKTQYASTSLIRFRDSLAQKLGGWQRFVNVAMPGVPRDLHAWEDLAQNTHLLVGTTTAVEVITSGAPTAVTPQTLTSDFAPNFSTVQGQFTVGVTDSNIANVTVFDCVFFNTPVSVGGIILSGLYPIVEITGTTTYNITAATAATATVNNGGAVPVFTTTNGNSVVQVTLASHGLSQNNVVVFNLSTSGNGVTIDRNYPAITILSSNAFDINVTTQATASSSFNMNGGNCELVYYIQIGPPPLGSGYGTGGYGSGGYGTGQSTGQQTGSPITATDYTSDNWGEIALFCPAGGGVYSFDPTGGFLNGGIVSSAPPFNGGCFVSSAQEVLVVWGTSSATESAIGIQQDPLLVGWSSIGNYRNFTIGATSTAGFQRLSTGSKIMGGIAAPQQDLIFTDLDCWAMNFIGTNPAFGFVKIGAGAGLISSHAVMQLRGNVYWMGNQNFYSFTSSGIDVMPCSEWDFVFQNLDPNNTYKVRAMPNTPFDEVGWFFTSVNSPNGENDCYVKVNILEPNRPWDFGPSTALPRSAWIDQNVLGMPMGASPSGLVYQHETTLNADGQALSWSFTTGYFYIAEGEDYAFVDQILPDFIWGLYGQGQNATVQMSFNVVNYPSDTPTVYGPFSVTQSTEYIPVRLRGRQMSFTVSGGDFNSFVRLGRVRYRYAMSGRR